MASTTSILHMLSSWLLLLTVSASLVCKVVLCCLQTEYEKRVNGYMAYAIDVQEKVGLDVLVHGEPERSDMCASLAGLPLNLFSINCRLGQSCLMQFWVRMVQHPFCLVAGTKVRQTQLQSMSTGRLYSPAGPSYEPLIMVGSGIRCRVEYFGQKLEGFAFTTGGWVQSYGSRYVRPPLIYADVVRPAAMTVKEFQYAQSLTRRPVKGMLTGAHWAEHLDSCCFLAFFCVNAFVEP